MTTRTRPRPEPLFIAVAIDQVAAQALEGGEAELRGRAFAVVQQNAESHKASVYSVSASAREMGVHPGMPVFIMRRKLGRRVAVVPRSQEEEERALGALRALLSQLTPAFEMDGRGSALLDLAGTPAQRALGWAALAELLRQRVRERTGMGELGLGISRSALVARSLAREAQPNGTRICEPGEEGETLTRMDLDALPGLSGHVREAARKYGLHRVDQIQELDRSALTARLGRMEGETLYGLARGVSGGRREQESGAVSAETVLTQDINYQYALAQYVRLTADRVCDELRRQGLLAPRVALRLQYTDNQTTQRSLTLSAPTDDLEAISEGALGLFEELYVRRVALKSVQIIVRRPARDTGQIDLFEGRRERRRRSLGRALTDIRGRMGFEAVMGATALEVGVPSA